MALFSDPTRNLSSRAADTGARLPGGIGGAPWFAKALWRSHWWLDCMFGIAVMNIVGLLLKNVYVAFTLSWIVTEFWGVICTRIIRRWIGIGIGCCEGLVI